MCVLARVPMCAHGLHGLAGQGDGQAAGFTRCEKGSHREAWGPARQRDSPGLRARPLSEQWRAQRPGRRRPSHYCSRFSHCARRLPTRKVRPPSLKHPSATKTKTLNFFLSGHPLPGKRREEVSSQQAPGCRGHQTALSLHSSPPWKKLFLTFTQLPRGDVASFPKSVLLAATTHR